MPGGATGNAVASVLSSLYSVTAGHVLVGDGKGGAQDGGVLLALLMRGSNNLGELTDPQVARENLLLGSAAEHDVEFFVSAEAFAAHLSDYDNPHHVTAAQVLPSQANCAGYVLSTDGETPVWIVNTGGGGGGGSAARWLVSVGAPSNGVGADGDMLLDGTTGDVYKKVSGAWVLQCNIRGLPGADGAQGEQGVQGIQGVQGVQGAKGDTGSAGSAGTNGATWYSGSTVPGDGTGVDGDFYLNTATDDVSKKTSGTWSVIANIKGATGSTGSQGSPGAAGAAGSVWRTGTGAPSNGTGVDGDFYLEAVTGTVYLRASGTYSSTGTVLKGATGTAGTNGTNGTNGATWRTGTGAPSNGTGVTGDLYLRTDTGDVYVKGASTYTIACNIATLSASTALQLTGGAMTGHVTLTPKATPTTIADGWWLFTSTYTGNDSPSLVFTAFHGAYCYFRNVGGNVVDSQGVLAVLSWTGGLTWHDYVDQPGTEYVFIGNGTYYSFKYESSTKRLYVSKGYSPYSPVQLGYWTYQPTMSDPATLPSQLVTRGDVQAGFVSTSGGVGQARAIKLTGNTGTDPDGTYLLFQNTDAISTQRTAVLGYSTRTGSNGADAYCYLSSDKLRINMYSSLEIVDPSGTLLRFGGGYLYPGSTSLSGLNKVTDPTKPLTLVNGIAVYNDTPTITPISPVGTSVYPNTSVLLSWSSTGFPDNLMDVYDGGMTLVQTGASSGATYFNFDGGSTHCYIKSRYSDSIVGTFTVVYLNPLNVTVTPSPTEAVTGTTFTFTFSFGPAWSNPVITWYADNDGGGTTSSTSISTSFGGSPAAGTATFNWSVTDDNANTASGTSTVTIDPLPASIAFTSASPTSFGAPDNVDVVWSTTSMDSSFTVYLMLYDSGTGVSSYLNTIGTAPDNGTTVNGLANLIQIIKGVMYPITGVQNVFLRATAGGPNYDSGTIQLTFDSSYLDWSFKFNGYVNQGGNVSFAFVAGHSWVDNLPSSTWGPWTLDYDPDGNGYQSLGSGNFSNGNIGAYIYMNGYNSAAFRLTWSVDDGSGHSTSGTEYFSF